MSEQGTPRRATIPPLSISGLRVSYGPVVAVTGLDLDLEPGEVFGLLGPNGAGKTSTLSAVEGLLRPDDGTVAIAGIDAIRRPAEARAHIGVQLQTTSFSPELRLIEIVQLFAGLHGLRLSSADVVERLASMDLAGEARRAYRQLSGGQQQRLSLLVATLHQPALLLLDEPTAGLDPQARRQLWDRIADLRGNGGTVLLTTHSMEEAAAVCDRVAIIDHGDLLVLDSPADLLSRFADDPRVLKVAHGQVTLDDVFIGLTGSHVRD